MWIGDFFGWIGGWFKGKPHAQPAPQPPAPAPQPAPAWTPPDDVEPPPPEAPPAPTIDRVLLVGINEYPSPNALHGCVNDVLNVKDFLIKNFGFKDDAFRVILDGDATTAAIMDGIRWLAGTPKGGRAYFHYSGHGAQVPTGDPCDPSALFQVICPVDFDWTMAHMVTDKQFVAVFKDMVPGVRFYWGSDSCHSGGLDKGLQWGLSPRYMRPTPRIAASIAAARAKGLVPEKAFVEGAINVGFLSGCRADQTSADAYIDGTPCGAFTHYMLKALAENPGKTLDELAAIMRQQLSDAGYEQQPQAEGPRAGMAFMA